MGNIEVRYVSREFDDLQLLLILWMNVKGLEIEIEIDEIKGD